MVGAGPRVAHEEDEPGQVRALRQTGKERERDRGDGDDGEVTVDHQSGGSIALGLQSS